MVAHHEVGLYLVVRLQSEFQDNWGYTEKPCLDKETKTTVKKIDNTVFIPVREMSFPKQVCACSVLAS